MMRDESTFALIGERYLDSQHDLAYVQELEAELASRGIVGLRRAGYEYVAAGALWWNFVWMDWICLDESDVRVGWISNAVVFGMIAIVAGYHMGLMSALVSLVVLHLTTLGMGFFLRGGSLRSDKSDDKVS